MRISILLLIFLQPQLVLAAVTAEAVKGMVLARPPLAIDWQPVRTKSTIIDGSMVQVMANSSLTLKFSNAGFATADAKDTTVKIDKPMLLRVSPDLMRRVALKQYYFKDQDLMQQIKDKPKGFKYVWNDAWERAAAMFAGDEPDQSSEADLDKFVRENKSPLDVKVNAKAIELLRPSQHAIFPVSSLPMESRLEWIRPKGVNNFKVYLWGFGEPKPAKALATTGLDSFTFKIWQAGNYFLQVTSLDGKWQSSATLIKVYQLDEFAGNNREKPRAIDPSAMKMQYPPANFTMVTSAGSVTLDFQWHLAIDESIKDPVFILEVVAKGDGSSTIKQLATRNDFARMQLKAGKYSWNVRIKESNIRSVSSDLQIVMDTAEQNLTKLISASLKSNTNATLFLGQN